MIGAMVSQITSLASVYSTVYSGAEQRKHQSSASLAFVRGIHRWPVNSPHKWPVTRKMFLLDDVIMKTNVINSTALLHLYCSFPREIPISSNIYHSGSSYQLEPRMELLKWLRSCHLVIRYNLQHKVRESIKSTAENFICIRIYCRCGLFRVRDYMYPRKLPLLAISCSGGMQGFEIADLIFFCILMHYDYFKVLNVLPCFFVRKYRKYTINRWRMVCAVCASAVIWKIKTVDEFMQWSSFKEAAYVEAFSFICNILVADLSCYPICRVY